MVIICFNMFFSGPASWSSGNTFVSGAGGLRFNGQIWKWSPGERPRRYIFKSLVLALKLKSLALDSKPTSPQKCPVLDSGTALFLIG